MSDFSFKDLGKVHWPATLKVVAARGFASGLLLALVPLSAGMIGMALLYPFAMAILALPLALLIYFAGKVSSMFVPAVGAMVQFIGALVVCIGDPIVYFVNRQWPALLNVADFKFFNFRPMIFVTNPN